MSTTGTLAASPPWDTLATLPGAGVPTATPPNASIIAPRAGSARRAIRAGLKGPRIRGFPSRPAVPPEGGVPAPGHRPAGVGGRRELRRGLPHPPGGPARTRWSAGADRLRSAGDLPPPRPDQAAVGAVPDRGDGGRHDLDPDEGPPRDGGRHGRHRPRHGGVRLHARAADPHPRAVDPGGRTEPARAPPRRRR